MKLIFERLRRATWTYRQPLTRVPAHAGAPVSDLFVWRNSSEWETFFDLTNLPALFEPQGSQDCAVTLMFFDAAGRAFQEKSIEIPANRRNTLSLSGIIGQEHGTVGTFAVFHAHTPQNLLLLGSHISERGYVSYRYRSAHLRAYVHGNLDAIARLPDRKLQLLGGSSMRRREYALQHALAAPNCYELGIVNPTARTQSVDCRTLSATGKLLYSQTGELAPGGCTLFSVVPDVAQQRIVVRSRLAMARPLVFRVQKQTMDVFHG